MVETVNIMNEAPREVAERRIVERFSRNDDGGIIYGYTVEDANYTDSYSAEVSWRLTDKEPYEFACHEGNHAMIGILAAHVGKKWSTEKRTAYETKLAM